MEINRKRNKILIYSALTFFLIFWILPLLVAFVKSFDIGGIGNYLYVLTYEKVNYFKVISNSLFIAAITSLSVVIITSLASYAFSKMEFKGKQIIYIMLLACLAVPVAAVTASLFFTIKNLGFIDKYLGVILPLIAFNAPLMLMMIKNYFDGIPNEIIEAAKIDGCSTFKIYRIMMLPLSVPIIANVAVLTFVYAWNDYLVPLLVTRSESKYTVTLASQYFMETTHQGPEGMAQLFAALILMAFPSIIVYLFSQKYLQGNITSGAVKS